MAKQQKKKNPPLTCYGCGLSIFNDHSCEWLGQTWDNRHPYCFACAPHWETYDPYTGRPTA